MSFFTLGECGSRARLRMQRTGFRAQSMVGHSHFGDWPRPIAFASCAAQINRVDEEDGDCSAWRVVAGWM